MTLEEFDFLMEIGHRMERSGQALILESSRIELKTLSLAGIEWVSRDPGFPCWTIRDYNGYFNSPRDALQASRELKEVSAR